MKELFVFVVFLLAVGCGNSRPREAAQEADSVVYPLSIDSGRKIVYERGRMGNRGWEVYLDTVALSAGDLYRRDTVRHPLKPFYLSYEEWETIACIVAIDKDDYLDKSMIALIERSGKLRIHYQGVKTYLVPQGRPCIGIGAWSHTFKNDSLEISVSGTMIDGPIMRCLTGPGKVVVTKGDRVFEEPAYLVYEKGTLP